MESMGPTVYGIFVLTFLGVLTLFTLFSTGSIVAVLVLWLMVALIFGVLFYYGFVDVKQLIKQPEEKTAPTPAATASASPSVPSVRVPEVFHINERQFTYDEASAVCAAYDGKLATLEQVIEAYNNGAEWCSYGWSAGGMALYPTQKATWQELQREVDQGRRTACGRPGVNGGYMDPSNKFGVNCYGFKPAGEFTPPAPVPGTDMDAFRSMVNNFKAMIHSIQLSPWSRQQWSEPTVANYGRQFRQEHFTERIDEFSEAIRDSTATHAVPYGLVGPTGPAGPIGVSSEGPRGPRGFEGPTGPRGPTGPIGVGVPSGAGGAASAASSVTPTSPSGPAGPPADFVYTPPTPPTTVAPPPTPPAQGTA